MQVQLSAYNRDALADRLGKLQVHRLEALITSVKAIGAESLLVLLPSCPGLVLQRTIVGLDPAPLLLQPLLELRLLLADDGLP